ncbi:MAG: phosphate ABC transporter, permease protein PstA [Ponticaulis sp.]|nr:phosphate ABC transporter, permease protein PstA [Ponticaulis sp.]
MTSTETAAGVHKTRLPISDDADLYLKGVSSETRKWQLPVQRAGDGTLTGDFSEAVRTLGLWRQEELERFRRVRLRSAEREVSLLANQLQALPEDDFLKRRAEAASARLSNLQSQLEQMEAEISERQIRTTQSDPSVLIRTGEVYGQVTKISGDRISYDVVLEGLTEQAQTQLLVVRKPVGMRAISDVQIMVIEELKARGQIGWQLNTRLLSQTDSSEAELAGLLAGLLGSVFLMVTTMLIAVPVGIAAAIYLEEFAPRNTFTNFVQVNINNLAAVPSIVFGLLGAAILVNGVVIPLPFVDQALTLGGGLGRGWPLVGGIVLALMTLPTIIISSRAALSSVPNSIRQGALAVGASRLQMIHHHVLPIAGPGILTGSIIGLAQALGETAPLLLIGMVAFLGDMPTGVTDRATALPVLIFQWSTRAERAWEPLTSVAIIILLALMLCLNGLAVWLRMRFDKR